MFKDILKGRAENCGICIFFIYTSYRSCLCNPHSDLMNFSYALLSQWACNHRVLEVTSLSPSQLELQLDLSTLNKWTTIKTSVMHLKKMQPTYIQQWVKSQLVHC